MDGHSRSILSQVNMNIYATASSSPLLGFKIPITGSGSKAIVFGTNLTTSFSSPVDIVVSPDATFAKVSEFTGYAFLTVFLLNGTSPIIAGSAGNSGSTDFDGSNAHLNLCTSMHSWFKPCLPIRGQQSTVQQPCLQRNRVKLSCLSFCWVPLSGSLNAEACGVGSYNVLTSQTSISACWVFFGTGNTTIQAQCSAGTSNSHRAGVSGPCCVCPSGGCCPIDTTTP